MRPRGHHNVASDTASHSSGSGPGGCASTSRPTSTQPVWGPVIAVSSLRPVRWTRPSPTVYRSSRLSRPSSKPAVTRNWWCETKTRSTPPMGANPSDPRIDVSPWPEPEATSGLSTVVVDAAATADGLGGGRARPAAEWQRASRVVLTTVTAPCRGTPGSAAMRCGGPRRRDLRTAANCRGRRRSCAGPRAAPRPRR